MVDYDKIINDKTDEALIDIDNDATRKTLKKVLLPIGKIAFWCGYYKADFEIRTKQLRTFLH
jgi:hypothetical protein